MEDILRDLIAIPSVSEDKQATHQLLEYVAGFVAQRGMHVEWLHSEGFETIVATVRPGHKTPKVMLAAHADVVPGPSESFKLRKLEGKYYGRGVLDMKFAIAAYLQIIDDLQEDLQSYDIGLMVTGDEELGGRNGTAVAVDAGYIPQVCILPDGGDDWQIQTGSKGILLYEISVDGVSAHGSRPWLGDNALIKLLGVMDEIAALFPRVPTPETNTISLTRMRSGEASNQVPNTARMHLDIRVINAAEYQRLNRAIYDICRRNDATCTNISDGAPTSFSLDDPLIAPYARLVAAVTGVEQTGYFAMGSSDARFFVPYGIPCISVYPKGGGLHADGEWLDADALQQFRGITTQYLQEIARVGPQAAATVAQRPELVAELD